MTRQLPLDFEFRANQSFKHFYPGANLEIVEHLKRCAEGEGEQQVFIWGEKGLGKTHLLQASCKHAYEHGKSSFYYVFDANQLPELELFSGLEEIDLVCFDACDALAGHSDLELHLFNFYNRHREQGGHIILSASLSPQQLPIRLPDLKTRLNWGLSLKLQPLSDDDRIHALNFKAAHMGFELSPKIGRFLLDHYARDPVALWQLLDELDKATLAAKRKLTLPFLKQVLQKR